MTVVHFPLTKGKVSRFLGISIYRSAWLAIQRTWTDFNCLSEKNCCNHETGRNPTKSENHPSVYPYVPLYCPDVLAIVPALGQILAFIRKCLRKAACIVGVSVCTLWKILKWDMKVKFYWVTPMQKLTVDYKQQCRHFCEWLLVQKEDFEQRVIWTDGKFFFHQKSHRKNDG